MDFIHNRDLQIVSDTAEKGIAGRGILLDWAGWMESKNASFDVFNVHPSP
jgi:hypothetical protein